MLEPDDRPQIFSAIEAEDREWIEVILRQEGIDAILKPYQGETAIDHVFRRLDTAESAETFRNCITIACRLLEVYRWASFQGDVRQDQRLDLQHHLGRAIYYATTAKHIKTRLSLIVALVKAGARINEILLEQPYTALGRAIIEKDRLLVALLLENGADPEITNIDGSTSIELAISLGARNILWDMLIQLRLHRADTELADIFVGGYPDQVNAMLTQGKLAGGDILSMVGVALWLAGDRTAYALLRHYLATAPDTDATRNMVYLELLFGLVRTEDVEVFEKLSALGLYDTARTNELLPLLIEQENDVLAAALIDSPFRHISVIQAGPGVPLPYCPAYTAACMRGLKKTVKALLRANFLTPDMATHALNAAIECGNHELIGFVLRKIPVSPQAFLELLHQAATYDYPYCLHEVIEGGGDLSLWLQGNMHGDTVITQDNYDGFLLSICCQSPEVDYHEPIFRFACALILLEATSGPVDRLNRLCDFIFMAACEEEDIDAIRLLACLGISPEVLLWKFVIDYQNPLIQAGDKDILTKGVVVACKGVVRYLDALLAVKSHELILEGCMGLFRIDALPTLPLNIGLINALCEIADNPGNFPAETVAAVEAVVKSIITLFRRISETKTLFDHSSKAFLALETDEAEDHIDSYFETFSMIFGEAFWTELLVRRAGATRRHYQLMALQQLLEIEGISPYYNLRDL